MRAERSNTHLVSTECATKETTAPAAATPASPLLPIAPGPTRITRSTVSVPWHGLLLEKHVTSPGERKSASISSDVVSLLIGSPSNFEYRSVSGGFVRMLNRAGTITITPAGPVPDLRLHTTSEFIHCALDQDFLRGITAELDCRPPAPIFRPGIQDKAIRSILTMLMEELETSTPFGRLYVDSLAHALATRYLLLGCTSGVRAASRASGLPPRILNRVREKIEANLEADLSLDTLAEETGYSRAHFLRMFRTATGLTPHQYVIELRLSRAQDRLRQKDASIIDVAVSCGFASQSHMTSVFRQRLEITPAEFRRQNSPQVART